MYITTIADSYVQINYLLSLSFCKLGTTYNHAVYSACITANNNVKMDRRQKHYILDKVMELLVSDDIDIEYFDTVWSDIDQIYKRTKGESSESKL